MVAEKAVPSSRQGTDGGDNERWNNSGWDEDNIRFHFPPLHDSDPNNIPVADGSGTWGSLGVRNGNTVWRRYFGSAHTGGINAVLGDGSVRFIRFGVDPLTYMRAIVIDDGQVFDASQF